MYKSHFYTCVCVNGRIEALKVYGHVDGAIGLNRAVYETKEPAWVATHIPTGILITDKTTEHHKTRENALKSAKAKLYSSEAKKRIEAHEATKAFADFTQSKYEQSVTKVF
jgi:protein subunit release factor A